MVSYWCYSYKRNSNEVLILVVVDDGLVQPDAEYLNYKVVAVLILVVVDDGLVLGNYSIVGALRESLNPCCSGRWSRTDYKKCLIVDTLIVLILVVVDDGLVLDLIRLF